MCINVIKIEVQDKSVVPINVQIPNYHPPTLKVIKNCCKKYMSLCILVYKMCVNILNLLGIAAKILLK